MNARSLCLVIFDASEARWLVPRASELAAGLDAHLTAIHPFTPILFANAVGSEPMLFSSMIEWEETESARIRALLEETLRRDGIQGEYRAQAGLHGTDAFLLAGGRGADLVIVGTNGTEARSPDDRVTVHRMIRDLGRPVLVLPEEAGGLRGPASRIVIGWTETREAARAAHDARLLAAPGAEIELVSVLRRAEEAAPGISSREDLAAALDRHGFRVTLSDRSGTADDRAETLLRAAREAGADLLVTGAFGHSQVYDMLIGAVTRDLLENAKLPVLLSR
ncbi:universal stress protein [Roseibacterium sp. SDUM158017]|uniref:universal stress protein n=1 Tax=Roseicyclus salinarum TaxID=3036773 RepID=UPI0024152F6A|nr:universal stress protein [Roseibacterium sp. SDUM158017]MDG4648191.1 universal stress protein [Roseibacterium sp. SDUM158017]